MSANIIDVDSKIIEIRNTKVLLDSDVAVLYGVETKRINEAVSNNPDKFPAGYLISLKDNEIPKLRSKISTTLSSMSRVAPKAFTEKGLYMLATILKSPQAVQTTLAIIETFAKMRELSRTIAKLPDETNEEEQKSLMKRSGELISELFAKDLQKTESETSLELNLAMVKVKHSVKQEAKNITEQMKNAKELLDSGTITSEEFEKLKKMVLK